MAAGESGIPVVSTRWAPQQSSILPTVNKTQRLLPFGEPKTWWRIFYRGKQKLGTIEKELLICHNVVTFNTWTVRKALGEPASVLVQRFNWICSNSVCVTLLPPGKNSQFYMNMKIMWNGTFTLFCDWSMTALSREMTDLKNGIISVVLFSSPFPVFQNWKTKIF